jgi:hypothetical protein
MKKCPYLAKCMDTPGAKNITRENNYRDQGEQKNEQQSTARG